jgi:hypothetical protein
MALFFFHRLVTSFASCEIPEQEPEQQEQISPQSEARDAPLLIPIELCPEETKLYAQGQTIALKVSGLLTPEGILVQEVTLIR